MGFRTYDVIMTPSDEGHWVLKSEAEKIIRHSKYKRCVAMAKWCNAECEKQALKHNYGFSTPKERWFWKWHKRWLELAEKFKEAK